MDLATSAVLGLDAGTTSAKAVLLDQTGATLGAGASNEIVTRQDAPGASEQDPNEITAAIRAAIRAALDDCDIPITVTAAAMAAQSGSAVPVGSANRRGRVVTWMDTRAQPVVDSWPRETRDMIRAISGWSAGAGVGLATIAWLTRSQEVAPARWASVDDHLVQEMSGQWVTNPSNASGMELMDVSTRRWSRELCQIAGIEPGQLSRIEPSGHDLGPVGPRGAGFGLAESVRLIVGGHDQACAAFGLGALEPGDIVLSGGTAWVMSVITQLVAVDSLPPSFNLSPHVVDERWSASKNIGPLGAVIADCLSAVDAIDIDDVLAGTALSDDDPHFALDLDDPERSTWGDLADPAGGTDPVVRARAAFEACAFEVRRAIEDAPTPTGDLRPIIFVGGGTRSRYLCQRIADATAREVLIFPDKSWPAIGAARIGATAVGWSMSTTPLTTPISVVPRIDVGGVGERRYVAHQQLTTGAQS